VPLRACFVAGAPQTDMRRNHVEKVLVFLSVCSQKWRHLASHNSLCALRASAVNPLFPLGPVSQPSPPTDEALPAKPFRAPLRSRDSAVT
jgi:hypothetical protein